MNFYDNNINSFFMVKIIFKYTYFWRSFLLRGELLTTCEQDLWDVICGVNFNQFCRFLYTEQRTFVVLCGHFLFKESSWFVNKCSISVFKVRNCEKHIVYPHRAHAFIFGWRHLGNGLVWSPGGREPDHSPGSTSRALNLLDCAVKAHHQNKN